MKLEDVISEKWLDGRALQAKYTGADPFPHIVMPDFVKPSLLESVLDEFPDLSQLKESVSNYNSGTELKYASEGMGPLSGSAFTLTSYINSGVMMDWLSDVTGINDSLISDPYLRGGGYHEIKRGGFLKVHADFNKHERYFIDRRLNLLIYLNKSWERSWGGGLQFFDRSMRRSLKTI